MHSEVFGDDKVTDAELWKNQDEQFQGMEDDNRDREDEKDQVDEAEIFEGAANRMRMTQTYTLEFQCNYKLQRYPFDSQVNLNMHLVDD